MLITRRVLNLRSFQQKCSFNSLNKLISYGNPLNICRYSAFAKRNCCTTIFYNQHVNLRIHILQDGRGFLLDTRRFLNNIYDIYNDKDIQENAIDQTAILKLFPEPRVTLNEFASKCPEKTFDIHYKQHTVTPKIGKKKKGPQANDWTCVYAFVWPENVKFESKAISKKQAAEKAATQALLWLYNGRRIDKQGKPIHDRNALNNLKKSLNDQICIELSNTSEERINRIWKQYEISIKSVYERTHEKSLLRDATPAASAFQDSTIDHEDEYSDDDYQTDGASDDQSEIAERKIHPVYGRVVSPLSPSALKRRSQELTRILDESAKNLTPLPMDDYTEALRETLETSRVVVVVGAAGCGKSTRVPPALLRGAGAGAGAGGGVLVAEPRRVAALGLAAPVAADLGENVGQTVGYQVRLDAKLPQPVGGSILFCTSGILLRRLQTNPGLEGCTHVVIDEAHERDINTDIILLLLKKAMALNPELKVVIMSATIDTEIFTNYFDSCPIIEVPGRKYPVEVTYLEDLKKKYGGLNLRKTLENLQRDNGKPYIDCNDVASVIKAVDSTEPEGAILVFLPGWAEIRSVMNVLGREYLESSRHLVLPVHSRLSTVDQAKIFGKTLPGVRKLVLATNIAETSVTIPDAVHVVDCGAHKEHRLRPETGTSSLETVWISQAAAKQRCGRAGRMRPGHCIKLYTRDKEQEFVPHNTPEILRVPLEQTVLNCKSYAPDVKVEDFLAQLPQPPSDRAVACAVNDLIDLGALTARGRLSARGRALCGLAAPPRLGCALLLAAVLGAAPGAADAATQLSTNVEVFADAGDRKEEIRNIKREFNSHSDHIALHKIQNGFEEALRKRRSGADSFCQKYGLRKDRMTYFKAISNLYLEQLIKSNVVDVPVDVDALNRFSEVDELIPAAILSGSDSLLVTRRHLKTKGRLAVAKSVFTSTGDRAHIGLGSVNSSLNKDRPGGNVDILTYFGGYHSTERRALVLHNTSLVTPHTVLLFSKSDIVKEVSVDDEENVVLSLPRHRIKVGLSSGQADAIIKAREMLWNTFQYYIECDRNDLDENSHMEISHFKVRLVKAIVKLLKETENQCNVDDHNTTDSACDNDVI